MFLEQIMHFYVKRITCWFYKRFMHGIILQRLMHYMKQFIQACSFYEQLMHYMQQFVEEWFYEQLIFILLVFPEKKALFIWLSACYCYKNVLIILLFLTLLYKVGVLTRFKPYTGQNWKCTYFVNGNIMQVYLK